MQLNERYKKFPIKFYQTDKGVYYENSFMNGKAKDLDDALKQLKDKDLFWYLFYNYEDAFNIKVGVFEPAIKNTKTSKGIYLGKLNIDIELGRIESEHTIKHLSKHPEDIKSHEKFMKQMQDQKKRTEFMNKLKDGIKKVAGYLQPVFEMFFPYKSREDLICSHCGEIIPTGTYYEEWKNQNYHLECIWDKLCNDKNSNTHKDAYDYFLSLQKLLNNWPGNLDCQDDYESDLELVKINHRNVPNQ